MTLEQCYAQAGGNLADAAVRLGGHEMVARFIRLFLKDDSFRQLQASFARQDLTAAFRAAHTLTGVCRNLSLTRLGDAASALTEALRGGAWDGSEALLEQVRRDYDDVYRAIAALDA